MILTKTHFIHLVALSLLLACGPMPARADGAIACPGLYKGHLQGVATDAARGEATAVFWSFTVAIVKTDLKGQLLKQVDAPTHQGDLTWHDGKVYVAVNLGKFNQEPGQADSWVYVYDENDLSLLAKHPVPEAVHGAGGIDFHNGHFFVVGGLPATYDENYVYEYDADFKFIKRHVVESGYTRLGIQTAAFINGYWWFGCYGEPKVTLKADENFQFLDKYVEDWSLGIAQLSPDICLRGTHKKVEGGLHSGTVLFDMPGTKKEPPKPAAQGNG